MTRTITNWHTEARKNLTRGERAAELRAIVERLDAAKR